MERQAYRPLRSVVVFVAVLATGDLSHVLAEVPVRQTWSEEYVELLGQIDGVKHSDQNRRERLATESLDQQALILVADRNPLDVVLRSLSSACSPST